MVAVGCVEHQALHDLLRSVGSDMNQDRRHAVADLCRLSGFRIAEFEGPTGEQAGIEREALLDQKKQLSWVPAGTVPSE